MIAERAPAGLLAVVPFVVAVACSGSGADRQEAGRPATGEERRPDATDAVDAAAHGAPEVEPAYQERIDEAWRQALVGENPASTCAGIKGRAAVDEPGAAARARTACNVDIPTRYFLTYVERVESGETTCTNLMVEMATKMSAMTISVEGLRDIAGRRGAGTSDAAATGAAGAVLAGQAASGGGIDDPREAIKERLRDPVTAACPDQADLILR